jgi:hypothetical protein
LESGMCVWMGERKGRFEVLDRRELELELVSL